jgi:hypothetical protein
MSVYVLEVGTIISVAREGRENDGSTMVPHLLIAQLAAASRVLVMRDKVDKLLPRPMSSARIPPLHSVGFSVASNPVNWC